LVLGFKIFFGYIKVMFKKLLLTTILLLGLVPSPAAACPRGVPNSLAYSERDDNRCEGIRDQSAAGQDLSVVAFYTTTLADYPNALAIRVPGAPSTPQIAIESSERNYLLDELTLRKSGAEYLFSLNTQAVLRRANISFSSLRGIAFANLGGARVHYPLILNQASSEYKFVIFRSQRTTLPTVEIRNNSTDRVVWNQPINTASSGYLTRPWAYGNAPAGRYTLRVVDNNGTARVFQFEHNPDWLP
jgi:hypothetical protein